MIVRNMKGVTAIIAIGFCSPAIASVTVCDLQPTEEIQSASFAVYMHEGFIHSVTLEYTTAYGDTLPYLFVCDANCVMDMKGDEFRFILGVEPELRNPETVTLITESKSDDFRTVENLQVESCNIRNQ